jgi:membrane fusion protein
MGTSLFRSEAVEFQHRRAWSGATTAPPLASWIVTGFLAISVAAASAFLAVGSYARKETVTGYLTPETGVAKLLPSAPGVVAELYVNEGDSVIAGQRLLLVRTERHGAQGQSVDESVLKGLKAKRAAIAERIDIERRNADERRRSLTEVIAGQEAEVLTLTDNLKTQHQRVQVAHDQVESIRPTVAQGITSMTEFRRRQDVELSQRQAETDLYRQISTKAVEVRESRQDLVQVETKSADTLAALQASLAEVDATLAEAVAKEGYVVSAPVSGRVTSLQAWAGMTTESGVPFLFVVPSDAPLQVSLLVPARAIGFIACGQPIRVAFDPFPYQRFGLYNGTIVSVSDILLKPNEFGGPIAAKEAAYRVIARLERQTVTAYGNQISLRPDTSLTADIIVDHRSLIEWLFDPLLSAHGRM